MTRIYTEDVNRDGIEAILQLTVEGYTLIPAKGIWQGITENSLIIEIFEPISDNKVNALSLAICELNNQDACAVVRLDVSTTFVSRPAIAA